MPTLIAEAKSALAERSNLVDAALAQEQCATEAEFEAAWRELKELKHDFIRRRATQALAASLASREPFADLDRAQRAAGTTLQEVKAGVREAKDAVEAVRGDTSSLVDRVAAMHARVSESSRVLARELAVTEAEAAAGPAPQPLVVRLAGEEVPIGSVDAARAVIAAQDLTAAEATREAVALEAEAAAAAVATAADDAAAGGLKRQLEAARAERAARAAVRATEALQAQDAARFYARLTQVVNEATGN